MKTLRLCFLILLAAGLAGCGPTYPKEKLADAVVGVCKKEYHIDVKSKLVGKTLAIYLPLTNLLDPNFGISEKALDTIQDVIMSASRVALSSDAGVQFYCIIAQDVKLPELQVVIIRYIEDIKRLILMDVSRGESVKRMLWDMNINPQAKKEEEIREIFKKHSLNPDYEEQILNDFFRSRPVTLKDFGYWQGRFYVRDITLPEFLAEQMIYRIKLRFKENKEMLEKFYVRKLTADYNEEEDSGVFKVNFDVKVDEVLYSLGQETGVRELFGDIFEEVSDCLYDYQFKAFGSVDVNDINSKDRLTVTRDEIYAFKKHRLALSAIMGQIEPSGI